MRQASKICPTCKTREKHKDWGYCKKCKNKHNSEARKRAMINVLKGKHRLLKRQLAKYKGEFPVCPRCGTNKYVKKIEEGNLVCMKFIRVRADGGSEKCWYHFPHENRDNQGNECKRNKNANTVNPLTVIISDEIYNSMLEEKILSNTIIRDYKVKLDYQNKRKTLGRIESFKELASEYSLRDESIRKIIYTVLPKLIKTKDTQSTDNL